MKRLVILALLLAIAWRGVAQSLPTALKTIRSVSGQFVVSDRRNEIPLSATGKDKQLLELEPELLLVSCERIKQAIYTELQAGRDWSGVISAVLRAGGDGRIAPQIRVEKLGSRWAYQVELPERIAREQFVRTLVQVVLLELANRRAAERSAEIPLWLSEGFTQRLLASRELELVLAPPTANVRTVSIQLAAVERRDPDPLAAARAVLRDRNPLTVEELSWPTPENFNREQTEIFQASAHVLVAELLRLKRGPEQLRNFVFELGQVYNWQTALGHAYPDHFPNTLAFAKWWTLQAEYLIGRDGKQLWTPAESAEKLATLLKATVAIRTGTNQLPVRTEVKLQTVLTEWDTVRQMEVLPQKLRELEQAQLRVAPPFMVLVHDYQLAVGQYIRQRQAWTTTFADFKRLPPGLQKLVRESVQKLDELDARRELIGAKPEETAAATAAISAQTSNK